MLDQGVYDLILMDCQMPEMDGVEALKAIRGRGDALSRIPVIAVTANAMPEERQACLAAGMDDYLSKPISKDALAAAIDRWSSNPWGPRAGCST